MSRLTLLALTLGPVVWSACARPPEPAPLPAKPALPPKAPAPIWSDFEASREWPISTEHWFVSRGHYGGTSEALVRVSPAAIERYRQHTPGAKLEPGTVLVMLHRSRTTGKRGPVHVMQRESSDWTYLLLEPDGRIVRRGALPLCARCHAEAVSDSVFGPPHEAGPE